MNITYLIVPMLIVSGCGGTRSDTIGLAEGKLPACPKSPNCVLSQTTDQSHFIEPLHYSGPHADSFSSLLAIIKSMKGTKIITQTENYIHVEFTSRLFRFVDDVEFLVDEKANVIHVRSASRVGYSDFGANRKRIEKIRKSFVDRKPAQ